MKKKNSGSQWIMLSLPLKLISVCAMFVPFYENVGISTSSFSEYQNDLIVSSFCSTFGWCQAP